MPEGGERSRESACLQCASTQLAGARRRQRRTRSMVHGENRTPYWIDRRLTGLAGLEYHAIISFGLPSEPEDSQYGKYRVECVLLSAGGPPLQEGSLNNRLKEQLVRDLAIARSSLPDDCDQDDDDRGLLPPTFMDFDATGMHATWLLDEQDRVAT